MLAWIVLTALSGAPEPIGPTAAPAPPEAPASQPAPAPPAAVASPPAVAASQPAPAGAPPWLPGPSATLSVEDQALGWWMTGGGTVGLLAGLATLGLTADLRGSAHDLGRATSTTLLGLGLGFLLSGIYVLATAAPGPCEASGTAIDGDGPQRF